MTPEQRACIEACDCQVAETNGNEPGCVHDSDHPSGQSRVVVPAGAVLEAVDAMASHLEALRDGTDPPGPEVFIERAAKALANTSKEAQGTIDALTADHGLPAVDVAVLRVTEGTLWQSVVAVATGAAAAAGSNPAEVLARQRQRALGLVEV